MMYYEYILFGICITLLFFLKINYQFKNFTKTDPDKPFA